MDLGLKGKRALVTSSSQGLGYATAMAIAREGASLIISARGKKAITTAADWTSWCATPGDLTARQKEIFAGRASFAGRPLNEMLKEMTAEIPAARMGRFGEIADVVAFLVSEKASYINDFNLLVDGGLARGNH